MRTNQNCFVVRPLGTNSRYPYKVEFYGSTLGIYTRLRLLHSRINSCSVNRGTTGTDPSEREKVVCHNGLLLSLLGYRLGGHGHLDLCSTICTSTTGANPLPAECRCTEGLLRVLRAPCNTLQPVLRRRRLLWVSKWRVWLFYWHFLVQMIL